MTVSPICNAEGNVLIFALSACEKDLSSWMFVSRMEFRINFYFHLVVKRRSHSNYVHNVTSVFILMCKM